MDIENNFPNKLSHIQEPEPEAASSLSMLRVPSSGSSNRSSSESVSSLPPQNSPSPEPAISLSPPKSSTKPVSSWPPPKSPSPEPVSSWPVLKSPSHEPVSSWPPPKSPSPEPVSSWPPPESSSHELINNRPLASEPIDLIHPTWSSQSVNRLLVLNSSILSKDVSKQNCRSTGRNVSTARGKRSKMEFDELEARVALAVWYRRNQKLLDVQPLPTMSARSKINVISSTTEGKKFIANKFRNLEVEEEVYSECSKYNYVCATYADLLGKKEQALEMCKKSLEISGMDPLWLQTCSTKDYLLAEQLSETERNTLWLIEKLRYEKDMKEILTMDGENEQSMKTAAEELTVKKVKGKELSLQQFQSNYCEKRRAVIITDLEQPTKMTWNLDYIRSECGDQKVSVKSSSEFSSEWANLEETETKKVSAFIDQNICHHYLFDWSLPLHAPELAAEFKIPEYFHHNFLTKTAPGAMYRESWPSLFIGPKGTKSGLHIDAFGSHFWMYLISGVKRWTFYPAESAGKLNPVFHDSMDPVFQPSELDLQTTSCYSLDLQPGEFLFVPAGSPHTVENLDDTIAVSGNFVNESNAKEFTKHMKVNALHDPRAKDLLMELFNLGLIS